VRFFKITLNESMQTSPRILGSFGVIDKKAMNTASYKNINQRTVFNIESNKHTIFTGIITRPWFLMSEELFEISKRYDPSLANRQIILIDRENKVTKLYYMPILQEGENLPSNKAIFKLKNISEPIVRLDLAESILRRECRGIKLLPFEEEV